MERFGEPLNKKKNKQVIFWRGPCRTSIFTELAVAIALQHRGYAVKFVICDGVMAGCIQGGGLKSGRPKCKKCTNFGVNILEKHKIPYIKMSGLVSKGRRKKLAEICKARPETFHGVPVGAIARASATRHLKGKPLKNHPRIYQAFLYSALVCTEAARVLPHRTKVSRLFIQQHREFVGWAPAYITLTNLRIPTTIWGGSADNSKRVSLRRVTRNDWKHLYALPNKVWKHLKDRPLTPGENKVLSRLLQKPWRNKARYQHQRISKKAMLERLGISNDKPIWCVFLQLSWDAGHGLAPGNFDDIYDWTDTTLQAIEDIDDVTWIVKRHPAGADRKIVTPPHIKLLPTNTDITTADLTSVLSGGVTMFGSVGMQLPPRGIPVIVGEMAHYSSKGFTHDASSKDNYIELLHQVHLIEPLTQTQIDLARRYAFAIYVRERFPFKMNSGNRGYNTLVRPKLLQPGADKVMSIICNKVISGGAFLLPTRLAIRMD